MFPENDLFEYVLDGLAEAMAGFAAPMPKPLPCDRWIARSGLQKGIRRGAIDIALAALATLFEADPRSIWRHLTIIALEDVGVAGMDVIASVVTAARNRAWRNAHGGDWAVASFLVREMCDSLHCQAACDLLLRSLNDPAQDRLRGDMLEADMAQVAGVIVEAGRSAEERGMAALAMGGGLADGQRHRDPGAVFDLLGEGPSSHVVATCRAAWRTNRNEMALLLPIVWTEWMKAPAPETSDDPMPPVVMAEGVPTYAVDQFTRIGGQVARALLDLDQQLRKLLDDAGITRARQPRAVGDLRFLHEGSCLARRAIWSLGDRLRQPFRQLRIVADLDARLDNGLRHIAAKDAVIADLCQQQLHHADD